MAAAEVHFAILTVLESASGGLLVVVVTAGFRQLGKTRATITQSVNASNAAVRASGEAVAASQAATDVAREAVDATRELAAEVRAVRDQMMILQRAQQRRGR